MNTLTLDSMVFDNFEVADIDLLASIEAGKFSWEGLGKATTGGLIGGMVTGAITGGYIGATGGSVVCPGLGTVTGAVSCGTVLMIGYGLTGAAAGAATYLATCWD